MSAPDIYSKQLSKKNLGFPLWQPDSGENPAVEIADVGYIQRGAFIRLFNASKDQSDRSSNAFGVPNPYVPIDIGPIQRDSPLHKGYINSESVSKKDLGLNIASGVPTVVQGGVGFSFSCESQQGAVLILGDFAYQQDVLSKQRFLEYIRAYYLSWLSFANNSANARGILIEDLILVTGCAKTSAWACAAFSEKSSGSSIRFRAGQDIAAASFVWGKWESESQSVDRHSGPQRLIPPGQEHQTPQTVIPEEPQSRNESYPEQPQFNQCVFLRGYKICDRKTFLMRKVGLTTKVYDGLEYVSPKFTSASRKKSSKDSIGDTESISETGSPSGEEGKKHADLLKSILSEPVGQDDWSISMRAEQLQALEQEIDLFLQLNYDREPSLLDTLLYYVLEVSNAQLAIVHDDDLAIFLQEKADTDSFESWLRERSPAVHVNNQVGMLQATHRVFLSAQDLPPDLTNAIECIGEYTFDCGGHADIYLGEWFESRSENAKVVMRVMRVPRRTSAHKLQEQQRRFLRHWYNFNHPNILLLCGTYTNFLSPLPATVSPLMRHGNVIKYLDDQEQQGRPCGLPERLNLLIGVASALDYLHDYTPQIIHGDLKGEKVLVSENLEAILGGFGRSRTVEDEELEAEGQTGGSLRWTAPELLDTDNSSGSRGFSTMSDVYAFGCLIVQIMSGRIPWWNIEADASVLMEVTRGHRPPVPESTYLPIDLRHLMESCWSRDVDGRPSMRFATSLLSTCARIIEEAHIPPGYSEESSLIQAIPEQPSFIPGTSPPPFTPTFQVPVAGAELSKRTEDLKRQAEADRQMHVQPREVTEKQREQLVQPNQTDLEWPSTVSSMLTPDNKEKPAARPPFPHKDGHEDVLHKGNLPQHHILENDDPASLSEDLDPAEFSGEITISNPINPTEQMVKGKMREHTGPTLVDLSAEDFVAHMQPFVLLRPVVELVHQIIEVCQKMFSNRSEAHQLQERCRFLFLALQDKTQIFKESEMAPAIIACDQQLNRILSVISQWSSLDYWESFLKQETVSKGMKACHSIIDTLCQDFQIQSDRKLHHWLDDFQVARREDLAARSTALKYIGSEDGGLSDADTQEIPAILELLQNALNSSEQESLEHQAYAESLYYTFKSSGELLPDIDLRSGTVIRSGKYPKSGNAAFDVWEGVWLGREKVAIKVIRGVTTTPQTKEKFLRETKVWREIWREDRGHYLVPFYGVCFDDGPYPSIVSPWMENGSMLDYLKNNPIANRRYIVKGIANGIRLLHNMKPRPIVHGDIKGVNILINDFGQPLLTDPGLPRILEDVTGVPFTQSKGVSESYRWFSPELCTSPGVVSTYSDVFAYGMTVLEIMTERPPFSHLRRTTEVLIGIQKGERPRRPVEPEVLARGLDDSLWNLLTECWAAVAPDRPTIDEILSRL